APPSRTTRWKTSSSPSWRGAGATPRRRRPERRPRRAMRRIVAQARKELTQVRRDRLALTLALVLPLGLIALLGTSISLSVRDIPIVIQDLDQTPLSRQYADAFRTSLTFRVVPLSPATSPEVPLARGEARAAVIIPPTFTRAVRRGEPAVAQLLVDATDTNT